MMPTLLIYCYATGRFSSRAVQMEAVYEEKRKNSKPRGKDSKPPSAEPPDKKQHNFIDPESRVMKAGSGDRFE